MKYMLNRLALTLGLVFSFSAAFAALEFTISAPNGVGDVVALTNAFTELDKANTTDAKILLEPGVYDLTGFKVGTRNWHLTLEKKMANGLIAGTGDSPADTVIKGGGETDKYGIFYIWYTDASKPTVISNLTLTCGYSRGSGGAVYGSYSTYGCNLVLSHCIVSNNYAVGSNGGGGGGAIHVKARDCLFASNTCGGQHGGALLFYDMPNGGAWNCVFSNNTVNSGLNGGAVYIHNKGASYNYGGSISNCLFVGNSTGGYGGGLYASTDAEHVSYSALCQDCVFRENSAVYGGGVFALANTIVSNCTFEANAATYGGGLRASSSALCMDCTFKINTSSENGAGAYLSDKSLCSNSTFENNASNKHGSGAYITGSAVVSNCVISGNGPPGNGSSTKFGGGAYMKGGECVDCAFTGNHADRGGGADLDASGAVIRNSLFDGNIQLGWASGAAIYVNASDPLALVTNCVFNANKPTQSSQTIVSNAELVDCVITNHTVSGYVLSGCNMTRCYVANNTAKSNGQNLDIGTFYNTTQVFRTNVNCVVAFNTVTANANAITYDKTVINCTYISNVVDNAGSGANVFRNGTAYNTIFTGNRILESGNVLKLCDVKKNAQPYLTNCLYSVAGSGVAAGRFFNCRLAPNFKFHPTEDGGEYDIKSSSPAFNAGMIEDWMVPLLGAKDFAGRERIKYDTIDIGALECQYRPFFGIVVR